MEDDLVVVATFPWAAEAHAARIELDGSGVACVLADETAAALAFPGPLGVGGVKLLVRQSDLERARRILSLTPAGKNLVGVEGEAAAARRERERNVAAWFLATQAQLEARIEAWADLARGRLIVDHVASFSGDPAYALTLSDFTVPREGKRVHYFAQPHAHEPGATAGMMDVIEQLLTGRDLRGRPTSLDVDHVLAETILTFNPIGNPQGREAAPVLYWDGSAYTNQEFWCWMRGDDPEKPGQPWHRFDLWDARQVAAPDPVGIVYEQIDEFRYVEPNRSHLSSYFQLFFQMDKAYHYECWLDLHQTEFENSDRNCMVLLPLQGLASGVILAEDIAWGQAVCDAWAAAGCRPVPKPAPLSYAGVQAEYFRKNWGELHRRMNILNTEVKNNAADAPPEFQLEAQAAAILASIRRLVR